MSPTRTLIGNCFCFYQLPTFGRKINSTCLCARADTPQQRSRNFITLKCKLLHWDVMEFPVRIKTQQILHLHEKRNCNTACNFSSQPKIISISQNPNAREYLTKQTTYKLQLIWKVARMPQHPIGQVRILPIAPTTCPSQKYDVCHLLFCAFGPPIEEDRRADLNSSFCGWWRLGVVGPSQSCVPATFAEKQVEISA